MNSVMSTGKRNERAAAAKGRKRARVNNDLADRIVSRRPISTVNFRHRFSLAVAYHSRYSYLALSGDAEPPLAVAFHRNPDTNTAAASTAAASDASAKIRSIAGRAVHYCRFKRCVKTLADCTAIERAWVRCWGIQWLRLGGSCFIVPWCHLRSDVSPAKMTFGGGRLWAASESSFATSSIHMRHTLPISREEMNSRNRVIIVSHSNVSSVVHNNKMLLFILCSDHALSGVIKVYH